ncbi:uncharacterized protein [Primulina huaijiensis]|uniref:uncharacterized protein isoform X2 n=1 Tax=Primulina huaijiensis TaxID=1492673 RepID=UPI003CC74745
MAGGVQIQEPVLDTLRREDENEMDQAINITLSKIPVEGNIGDSHTPIESPDTLETDFEVKDSVKGNEGSASTIKGEKFLISPSAAEVHFEENNLAPDACQVNENAEKMAIEHATDALHLGEAKVDAEESNDLEKGLVSALEVPASSEVGHDESIPVYEAGLSENKEDSENTIPEKETEHKKSLKVNPEDTKTCVAVNDTETTSSVEEKIMTSSTSQDIPGERNEQTTFDTNKETPENISTIVPNAETEQNLSIELVGSQMKTDENLEKEDEKPESTLIPEGKIENEELTQNELFETKNETEKVIRKSEEADKNGGESSPVAAPEAEDMEASTSDHNTKASALENKIPTENPQEIEVDKSGCKPEKETLEEQVITETTTDASHNETTPVDKAKTEDEEPNKSDFIESKEDRERTILVEEPILEKHLESLNAIHDDIKARDLVQDTEAKSSIKEKLPTATPQEIWGDEIEQTSFDTKEETLEDISTNVSNEKIEQNSIVEVPFVTEALTTDNETEGKIKDEDQREKDSLENNNDTESELLKQKATEKPVESLQLANVAEATQASTLDHDTKISALENQILTENSQDIVADETESKPCDVVDSKKETLDVQDVSTIESNDDNEENLVIEEDESEKPLSREESTRDAAGDESTYTYEDKNEGDDQMRAELFEKPNFAESLQLIEDKTIPKLVESPQEDAEAIKTHVLDQYTETKGLISASEGNSNDGESAVKYEVKTEDDDQKEDQLCDSEKNPESNVLLEAAQIETPIESLQETLPSTVPQGFLDDKTEEKIVDAIQKDKEFLDNISTIVPNEETEQNLSVELDDSHMKTDENLEKEDEKPGSTLLPEGKIKNEESTQNELFETENETETVIQKSKEVIEKVVESSPVAASEAGDIETSTSDHDTETSSLENKIATENPQEIEVDKSECKPEKETPKEQVSKSASMTSEDASLTKHETHLEKESEKPCFKEASTRGASHDETTPVDKAMKEDDEPSKSELFENKEDTESTILVEEPILGKHLESLNAIHDDIKACDLVQDTETKSSIKEKLQTATPQEIWGDKIDQTSFDTKDETPEDISTNVSNEETEQHSIVEVPFVTEALTTDNETEGKIKDEDQREKYLLENNNDTESELLKQKATEKPVESLQLANVAEATQASTLDHDTKISALENQILTENSQEIVADETESKPCDVVDSKKETLDVQDVSTIESNDDNEENLVIEEDESEKPLSREESTRDAAGDESTYTYEDKNEGDDQRRAELFENPNFAESLQLIEEDNTIPKLVESPQVDAEVIKTHVLDQDTETTGLISASERNSNDGESAVKYEVETEDDDQKEDQLCDNEKNPESNVLLEALQIETPVESLQETLPSTVPQGFLDDKTEEKTVDAFQKDKEILDNISTIVPNEETEQNLSVELDDSHMKTDENLEKEDEKPGSTLLPEGKIKNEESTQNELFETENETETVIQKSKEVIEKVVESSPVAASEAGDIETSTSDHDTETSSLENKIATENPQEIEVDKSECKPEKETPKEQVSKSASMTSEDASLTKHETHLEKESEKPCFKEASTRGASHDETTPVDKAMKEDDEPNKSELFENKEDTKSTILVEEPILGKYLESLNAIHDDIKACDLVQDTETKSSIKEKLQTATPQEIWGDKIDQTSFDTKEKTLEDISTNVSNKETEQNSIVAVPFVTEALTTDNELAITREKIKDEDQRGKDLLENNNDTEIELLKQEVTEKPVESLQLANEAEDTKVSTLDHDTTLSVLENQTLTENPQEIVAGETESKPCDIIDTKKETLDGQDVSTIESNDDNEENLVIEEDESEKHLLREESIRDAVGDESIYTNEDKKEVADQRRAELFENDNSAESLSLIEDNTIPKHVKSPQVDAEDIKTHDLDQDAETTSLSNDGESAVKYEVKTEDDDQKEDQLCDSEKNPESNVLLEAAQIETPLASLQETRPSTVPQGFLDDATEEKTVDAIHTDKEILDVQNVTKTVSNEKIEEHSLIQMDGSPIQHEESSEKEHERPSLIESINHDSLFQVDGSQIQCKDYSEEKSEITSIIEASTKNINDDDPVNVHEGSSDHEDLTKDEFGDTEITSQEEEAQVETPANSTNIAAEDIIASDLCQETETTSSQEERTLNEEETVCEQREVETLHTSDTKTQTLETRDVSTMVPNDDSRENSATEENDLQMKNEETFGKETEKPSVNETSTTDASDGDSANKCEDKVEGEEQTGAELFENKKDTESKLLKEKEIMVRLVESPQVDNEAIKTYVSDEGAETTGMVEASGGYADNHESAVKNEVKTEDNDKKEELSENEKNTESDELLEAAQSERSIESLQETLPSTVPRGFLDDNTEEKTVDARQKDKDVQNVTTTVPNEKIEESSLIQMDGSQIQHEEYLEKEHEIPSVIEASTKHANYDELIAREDNFEHEDQRKVEPEIEKYTEINLKEDDAQIETHIAEDIIASDSYQATETTDSQEEQILSEIEIVHEETQVERLDAADTKKETPEAPDVSTFVLNDDNEENLVIEEDDSEMKNEDNLGKESENPPSIEASLMDTSSYESTKKFEDKGKEQTRAEDTECSLLKEGETAAQPLESPQVDAEDIKTCVSDQGMETTGLVEVFEEVADDSRTEVKCMIKTEDKDQKEDELCDNEKIRDGTLHLEVAEMEKPFESLKEALPTSIPRGFLDEKTEEKMIDATEKDEETLEIQQNVTTIVSNENIEHDSLLQVDGSQMQCKECPEGESERTPIIEASTKNISDDESINVHEDNTEHEDERKDELVETKEDTKITSQKEEAQVETAVKSLKIAAEDIIESDSRQETETMNSQEEQILNDEEIVCEQIEVETLDTADKKTETPEAQDVSTIVANDDIEANSAPGENDSQMKNKENLGKESGKPSVIEAWTMDASGDEPTNKHEDKVEGEEQTGTEMFVDKKDTESTLLKEEEIMVKLVEFPHADTENIKTYVSDEGAEKTGVVEAFEGNADVDKSAIKYEVKTEDTDQKDNEKNPESGALLEEAQIEKPIDSLKETLTSRVPREFLDDKTEEKTMDAIEKDKEILEVQSVAKTVSNEKIEDNSLIQAEISQIQHEEYLEEEIEIPSVIEALTKHADDDELTSIHEDNIEHKDLRKVELLESDRDTEINLQKEEAQMETSVKSLQVAAEDIIASDSYHETETTSQEEQFLNENEIIHERTEVERLDTADSDKEIPEAQNFATILSSENIKENSGIPEDGSEQKQEELLEKESKAPPFSETLTMEINDEVPEVIHQDKTEDEKLEKVDKFECDKHEEITSLNEAPAEKLQESSKEDLEDIKDIVSGANTIERSLIEVQSPNENIREIVGDHMDENIVDKDPEVREIEDEHLDNDAMFKNEKHTEIGFIKEEESVKKLQEPEKKDLEEIKAFVSHEGTETTSSIEERDLTAISQESVGDLSEDKILDKAQEIPDSTTVSGEHAEKYSSIHPDGSQMKHEELSEKECEMLSTPETSFLYSSNDEPMTVDVENIENKHLNKVDKLEDEKQTKIAIINDQALVEGPQDSSRRDIEEVKAFVSCEGAETSSAEERGLTEISPEIIGDKSEKKILDKIGTTQEFTKFVPDENGGEISPMLVDELQIKHEELVEKESEASPLSETSLRNSNFNESTILHQDKIEDEILNRVDKFESGKHAEISLIKEEAPVEKLNESSLRKDLEEIKAFDLSEDMETSSTGERNLTAIPQENDFKQTVSHEHAGENLLIQVDESEVKHEIVSDQTQENVLDTAPKDQDLKSAISHENAEENSLVQVDEIQMKHEKLEKESETPSLLMVDTSNKESKTIYEDITEDEYRKKIHDFECEKHEVITSTEVETQVTKVNESSKEDLEDVKALVSGEDSETTSFEEKQSLKENPQEILSEQQEEKILDIAHEPQNFIKVVSNENVEKDSMIQEDGSPMVHGEISEKEGETPSLSAAFILNTTSEDSTVIHENKIEDEDKREVDIFECEKHVDGKILDAAREAPESKKIVLDEKTEEKSSNQVDKSQTKHEELLEKESKTLSLSNTSLLNTSNEDSTTINDDKIEDEDPEKVELECEKHIEFPLTKEERGQIPNNPLKEDIEEIKEFVSCLDTETTSSTEDRSLQLNPQEVMGDQMEENIIDTTPELQNFTTLASDENTKKNLLLEDDESQIKHEELLENESEKPSLWILNTSNEESSFICHSKTEKEGVKRHEKVEQLTDFPEEGPEIIEVPVPSENLERPSPVEERSLTENPQENLTKDEILDVVPEALQESKTIVSDKNIEEDSFILEDGSQMKHEEHSEKESEKTSVSENSILNTRNEEPTLFLDDKIEEEDQAKGNKSECEKHAEITEVPTENPNSSNLENIEAFVSCEDIEPTISTEEQSLKVNPIENVEGQEVEKVLDKALEAPDFTPVVPDDNNGDNPSIQVDGSQMKLEEPLEKESEMPSSLGTSMMNANNEETENIHKDLIEDEALENVDEFESKKCSEINKLKEEAQVEESTVYKDIKAYVLYQDTEASALEEQILAANPQDILGNQSEGNVIDTADSKEKITEKNLPFSNENVEKDLLIQIDESKTKHEENLEKEPYLEKTSTVEANNESTTSHEDMIEEENGKIMESALLNEGSPAYESVESLQVVSEDIKASVSSQKTDEKSSNLNSDPQEIAVDQTDDKINSAGTREITLEALNLTTLDSNENKVLDSITPHDGLEIEDEEISMLADNEESKIVHEDTIEGEDLKKVDTFESAQQTEDTLLKEEAHKDASTDSLHVASEPIKASVSCQDRDPTSSVEEQILTTTPKIVVDQVEEKLADTAKTWEETPEVSSSVLAFQEDEANRIGVDDINSVMIKDEETVNIFNADENDEICSSDKVQAKEEEMEILSKTKIDEEADKDDIWIKLTDDETNKTSIEEKEIDFSSHDKDTSEITRHDGAKDIPKGNENSTAKNEFLEDGNSNGSTESTTPIGNEDAEKIDKDIKAETVITETGAASSALPITGVQCGPEETESEDSTEKETETSLAPEGREYQGQHTKIHESPSPPLSHVKDSEWEMAQERGRDNLQIGDDTKELDEGSVAISNEGNFLEANLNENIVTEVIAREKEASAIQQDPVSKFVMQEIQEQPGKTVDAVPEEKGIKSEQGEIKFYDSDDLKIKSSTMVTDKVAPSDILCSFTSDAGQRAVGQETQIVVQEKQKPGKGKAAEAAPEEKGINTEEDEIKEHNFNVLKENSRTVALDKVTPVNILQGSTTDAVLRATDEETPKQYGLDEARLKEIEGGPASTTDKLTVLRADEIDNANFDSSLGSNKIPVLQHGDSSESSQTEGEKPKTSEPEKGEKHGNEETAKLMEMSESTEMDKPSLSGLLQEPMKEVLKVVDHSIDKKEPTTKEEELLAEKSAVEHVEVKTDKEKDSEEESGENQISELSSDAPVMVGAADKDVKVAYKKSHNILSGVGSKVKHSISKVKKAITCRSPHPKSASPKYSDRI